MTSKSSENPPAGLEMSPASRDATIKTHDFDGDHSRSVTLNNSDEIVELQDLQQETESDSGTATNSSDEFDWEGEDDVSTKDAIAAAKVRRGRRLWSLFMKLARPIRTLLVAILGAGLFITPLLVFEFHFKSSVVRPHVHAWSLWASISWAAGAVTYLVVDMIPRIIVFIVMLFHGSVERLKVRIELLLAVSAWVKLTLDISWAWIALSVIRNVVKPPGSYWVIVNRVMQALFSAAVLLLAEKIFLRFVAIDFHRKALADRIAENQLGLKALDRLSNAQPSGMRVPFSISKKRGHKSPGDSRRGSVAHMVASHNAERTSKQATRERKRKQRKAIAATIVDQLGGVIGQVALKDSKFNKNGEVSGLHSAKKLARQLFSTLSNVHPPRSHLIVEDFYPYFNSTTEAAAAFAVFDKDGNGDITKKEMREAVQRIYRERKALVSSLKDVDSVVSKLDAILVVLALFCFLFICLLIFNKHDTLASLVPVSSFIVGFSFIFGHSAQTLFESLIFIFSTHVFDVGDLVMIDDQVLFVREFGLFSTTFRRVDGQEIIAPNSLLASSKIVHNLRRSNSMWESTNLQVAYDTPLEAVETLKGRLQAYVTQNNRDWSNVAVNIDKMDYQNAVTLIIAMEHRPNWQDWGGRWGRRTLFMRYLKTVLEELDISYTKPLQPVALPKYAPYSHHYGSPRTSNPYQLSVDDLGNAGRFQQDTGSNYHRAPGLTVSSAGDIL
ncbi:hypothetical protein SCHPADRAFT_830996 [Schizopora paradoxa]|uniref:EF-hand domain-containing protein n=1 Tax=Schizopora paradoxa TaxID=27342 RepID=A0A0H2RI89_9AGAM|nr:hypothetical protein SCHPADRAFT_830996 [Schizopora paradoxa]